MYKSPVFGLLARSLGFYPVAQGVDNSTDHLKEKVRQGYSLVVFPEGKRSFTNKLGRFHKGAFFLQEELKMDILPVYLHGNAEVMPKNDMIIHDGVLTVIVGERIVYGHDNFGKTYKERTKNIGEFYKNNFMKLRVKLEDESYFKQILFQNFWYKLPEIQSKIKEDFQVNKLVYYELQQILPDKLKILHIANDYGVLDILLVSKFPDRKITTWIENSQIRAIANQCYTSKNRKVVYCESIEELTQIDAQLLLLSQQINCNLLEAFADRTIPAVEYRQLQYL